MEDRSLKRLKDIQIRDPFIVYHDGKYYLFGSTDKDIWRTGVGFDAYVSSDLILWDGPVPVFRPDSSFWSEEQFWAPEVYHLYGSWYMFATFYHRDLARRGTAVLQADNILGPYRPWSDGFVTPQAWNCLDGTLFCEDGEPFVIFCHEWTEVGDGEICVQRLRRDLRRPAGSPKLLFRASEAGWATPKQHRLLPTGVGFVTDGPFLWRDASQSLWMFWSSFVDGKYALGWARSRSGALSGPWEHCSQPLWKHDGGHAMLFISREGDTYITFHVPNDTPNERAVIYQIEFASDIYVPKLIRQI